MIAAFRNTANALMNADMAFADAKDAAEKIR